MYGIFMGSHWPDVNIGLHNNRMMLQSNGKVSSVIRQSDKSTVSQERMRKLCLVPPFCVLCSTWYMYRGVASSWRKRTNGKEKTIGSRAQLTHTHTHSFLREQKDALLRHLNIHIQQVFFFSRTCWWMPVGPLESSFFSSSCFDFCHVVTF